jgi:hypothetical protein
MPVGCQKNQISSSNANPPVLKLGGTSSSLVPHSPGTGPTVISMVIPSEKNACDIQFLVHCPELAIIRGGDGQRGMYRLAINSYVTYERVRDGIKVVHDDP